MLIHHSCLDSHKTIMQLSSFQNPLPRQLVSISLEKTGSTTATGSSGFLHPPSELSCRTCCKMFREHLVGYREKVMRNLLTHRAYMQLSASVSQAHGGAYGHWGMCICCFIILTQNTGHEHGLSNHC